MDNEIVELQEEIEILNKRISILEKKENRRKSGIYLRAIIKIIVIGAVIFGIWRGYEYVVHEIPNMMEEKIKDILHIKK